MGARGGGGADGGGVAGPSRGGLVGAGVPLRPGDPRVGRRGGRGAKRSRGRRLVAVGLSRVGWGCFRAGRGPCAASAADAGSGGGVPGADGSGRTSEVVRGPMGTSRVVGGAGGWWGGGPGPTGSASTEYVAGASVRSPAWIEAFRVVRRAGAAGAKGGGRGASPPGGGMPGAWWGSSTGRVAPGAGGAARRPDMVSEARLLAVVAAARVARRVEPGGVVPRRCTRLGSLPKGEGAGGVDPR